MSFVTQGVALKPINLVCLRLSQVISLTPPMKKKKQKKQNPIFVCYLGEKSPPLPVPEFEIGGTVSLDNPHGCQLLLPLGERSIIRITNKDYPADQIMRTE